MAIHQRDVTSASSRTNIHRAPRGMGSKREDYEDFRFRLWTPRKISVLRSRNCIGRANIRRVPNSTIPAQKRSQRRERYNPTEHLGRSEGPYTPNRAPVPRLGLRGRQMESYIAGDTGNRIPNRQTR